MKNRPPRKLFIGAFVIGLFLLSIFLVMPNSEHIYAEASPVNEVTLKVVGFKRFSRPLPIYELGPARGDFEKVVLNGETYIQTNTGASLITDGETQTKYVIEEILHSKPYLPSLFLYETLYIKERSTGMVLASKQWSCTQDNCGEFGDYGKASNFVKKVLGGRKYFPYPQANAIIIELKPTSFASKEELEKRVIDCPSSFRAFVRKDLNEMVITNGHWTYAAPQLIHQAHCKPSGVFVVSGTYPEWLHLDWIDYSGKTKGQYQLTMPRNFPGSGGGTFGFTKDVIEEKGRIKLRMLYFHNNWPSQGEKRQPNWEYDVLISGVKEPSLSSTSF